MINPDWQMPLGVPSSWTDTDLQEHIRQLAHAGKIEWAYHSGDRRRERDFTKPEISRALRNGTFVGRKPPKAGFTGVKCKMRDHGADGEINVVVALSDALHGSDPFLEVVTVTGP